MTPPAGSTRRGRRPKGGELRVPLIAKLPAHQAKALIRDAESRGLPITDFLALLICERQGWDVPTYITEALSETTAEVCAEPQLDLDLAS